MGMDCEMTSATAVFSIYVDDTKMNANVGIVASGLVSFGLRLQFFFSPRSNKTASDCVPLSNIEIIASTFDISEASLQAFISANGVRASRRSVVAAACNTLENFCDTFICKNKCTHKLSLLLSVEIDVCK